MSGILEQVVLSLEARASHSTLTRPVFTRIGALGDKIFVDLCNDQHEIVEICNGQWTTVTKSEVRFVRSHGMLALPTPVSGSDGANLLRSLIHVRDERQFHLILAWLFGALRPKGPYPALVLCSEQGSGKTFVSKLLRAIVDPNAAPVRGTPRDERDLMIAAVRGWLVAFDNLSVLPDWLSDALCRLSTGGGLGTRRNYSDDEEVLFCAQRPFILTGIQEVVTREDLLDRCIVVDLPQIHEMERRAESELWAEFDTLHPQILGWLLDVVGVALNLGDMSPPEHLPRMADFAAWMAKIELILDWEPGYFNELYMANQQEAHEITVDHSIIGRLIVALGNWNGTATSLHRTLTKKLTKEQKHSREWPKSPRALADTLRRIAPSLRATGTEVEFRRANGGNRDRMITLKRRK